MESRKPIIVVVPGSFHRPVHYRKILEPLHAQGYETICVDLVTCCSISGSDKNQLLNPELNHFDDAAEIKKKLIPQLDEGRQAVVVSHSYGSLPASALMEGQTITERAARGLKGGIAAVINLAGFVWPARNKSITGDEEESTPPPPYQIWKDGIVTLLEDAKPLFFSDIPPEQAEIEFASLFRKQTIKSFRTLPQYVAADYQCPKTYVLSENDKSVPPEWQEKMAELGKHDIIRVSSGHASFLSIPEEIVAIITRVAESST